MTMRIALVLGTSVGGIGAHVRDLAAGLVERGDTVTVLGPAQTEESFGFVKAGARFCPVPIAAALNPLRDAAAVRTLRAALVRAEADVVHAHGVRAGALTALALGRGRPGRIPSVVTLHNAMLAVGVKARLLRRLEQLAVRRANVVFGASADLVERARELGARDARLGPVPAPQLPEPTRGRAAVRAELGVGGPDRADRVLVLAVGRLAPQKDYATLLQAVRIWQDAWELTQSPQSVPRLVVAGDGPLREQLQADVGRWGLDAQFLGHRTDVADLLAAADILVLSSAWEARALVVQEAMRAGVPVVATAVGGTPELVGDAAILVPPRDPHEIAIAVQRLAQYPDDRARLAGLGRERARAWPDAEQCVSILRALYSALSTASSVTP
ncbi:glycosyltransferase [Actinocrinis puniceicyclus]|uniref:Glycosyltransferase n=1 Tax=Actinocrinis puniceicyclus TaxID=977794 RepID=A0A8J7WSA0_9ACTN|nr:glycosyltransferase [Actinocrinis puniceicyclus]MBS2964695.1 glycosyltransferase [Actinocrinis puniceicyclus]